MTVFFIRRKKQARNVTAGYAPSERTGITLFDLKRGQKATVQKVNAEGSALARLTALGIDRGAQVEALAFSLFKSSILISCSSVRVSMRRALAQKIEVEF